MGDVLSLQLYLSTIIIVLLYQWFDGEEEEEGEEEGEEDYDDHEVELDQSDTEVTGHPVSSEIEEEEEKEED